MTKTREKAPLKMYHSPVLLKESIAGLRISPEGTYVDTTFGGGGHTSAILSMLGPGGRVIAFDQDRQALENAPTDKRLILADSNFRYMIQFLRYHDALPADGILADLGVSSHQIDEAERGFSIRFDGPVDMRMDQQSGKGAAALIAGIEAEELADILYRFGEVQGSRKIASAIIRYRTNKPIKTTADLCEAVKGFVPARQEQKFLAKIFQALRIAVNDELESLKEMLLQCTTAIRPGGRLAVISYHSLEDRLVKHFIRTGNFENKLEEDFYGNTHAPFRAISKKAIQPSEEEMIHNPRARSAKLRIAERV